MTNKIEIKLLSQDNLFEEGKKKYYIQFKTDKGQHVINVGETTFKKVEELTKNDKEKVV